MHRKGKQPESKRRTSAVPDTAPVTTSLTNEPAVKSDVTDEKLERARIEALKKTLNWEQLFLEFGYSKVDFQKWNKYRKLLEELRDQIQFQKRRFEEKFNEEIQKANDEFKLPLKEKILEPKLQEFTQLHESVRAQLKKKL